MLLLFYWSYNKDFNKRKVYAHEVRTHECVVWWCRNTQALVYVCALVKATKSLRYNFEIINPNTEVINKTGKLCTTNKRTSRETTFKLSGSVIFYNNNNQTKLGQVARRKKTIWSDNGQRQQKHHLKTSTTSKAIAT